MQFFQFLPLNLHIFAIYPLNKANLDNFSQKSAILEKFPLLKVQIWGNFSTFFSSAGEEKKFLAEYSPIGT